LVWVSELVECLLVDVGHRVITAPVLSATVMIGTGVLFSSVQPTALAASPKMRQNRKDVNAELKHC
jgi:hypothetical protein